VTEPLLPPIKYWLSIVDQQKVAIDLLKTQLANLDEAPKSLLKQSEDVSKMNLIHQNMLLCLQ
jgi:hypothetical protein